MSTVENNEEGGSGAAANSRPGAEKKKKKRQKVLLLSLTRMHLMPPEIGGVCPMWPIEGACCYLVQLQHRPLYHSCWFVASSEYIYSVIRSCTARVAVESSATAVAWMGGVVSVEFNCVLRSKSS